MTRIELGAIRKLRHTIDYILTAVRRRIGRLIASYDRLTTYYLRIIKTQPDLTCSICGSPSKFFMFMRGVKYFRCSKCHLVQSSYYGGSDLYLNVYKDKVHTASARSGRRELFFVEWAAQLLNLNNPRILIFAPGSTPTFKILSERGADVYAADISDGLPYSDRFIHLRKDKLPDIEFDIITMVEIIEHFDNPVGEFKTLSKHLAPDGIIAGTTDFHQGGALWNNKYLFPKDHVSYFHHDSLSHLGDLLGLECVLFEMEWSRQKKAIQNRRAFVIYRKDSVIARDAIYRYRQTCSVLPIERG
jgi:SAM-dependent methyltransferase